MIYPRNYEQKIGCDRVRNQIADLCSTESGRERLAGEQFSTSAREIERRLGLFDEVRTAMMLDNEFPMGEFTDMTEVSKKLAVEGTFLETDELIALHDGLEGVCAVLKFFSTREQYVLMRRFSSGIASFADIVNHIDTIVDRFGNVKDSASAELYTVRKAIQSREGQVAKRLQSVLAQAISAGYAEPDAAVSIRDGRAVIPVSASNKRKVNGFIHDQSATGKTYYIEPVEIVEINNEIKELEYAERREVIRILTEFTESIRERSDEIAQAGEYMASVDMIRAKARWAMENGAVKPILSDDGRLVLRSARHPLLSQTLRRDNKEIVPLDMTLTPTERILVISGPNAGGKSVCLKTLGLLQYMFQCGLPVPALENSEMPVFKSIFIDIGDEQSIDNDLSTYSSHLLNMKQMLAHAAEESLILIDEFGSGTEPVMGAAIAEAMLERFVESGTYGVITTHYSNIKYFAGSHEGVQNGAMMFDVQNIMPLFRLESGMPGSSFAVEIARKIGLPEKIIKSASDKAGSDYMNLERQLREIARDRRYWEQKRDRIRVTDKRVEELENSYSRQLAMIKEERTRIIKQAREEAAQIVAEANKRIENTIRTIKEAAAEKEATRAVRKEFDKFKDSLAEEPEMSAEQQARIEREMANIERRRQRRAERKAQRGEQVAQEQEQVPEVKEPEVGCKVRIKGQDGVGEVMQMKGRKATVAFGQILTTVEKDRLEVISNAEYKRQTRAVKPRTVMSVDISSRKLNFKDNIDIRGMRAAEALEEVKNFIDDALMVGVSTVTILHGKGTGALKEEVRRYLRGVSAVESATDDHPDRGGAGITVVRFSD